MRGLVRDSSGFSAPPAAARGTAGSSPERSSSPPSAAKPIASATASTLYDERGPIGLSAQSLYIAER